jgi:hypothetical protein
MARPFRLDLATEDERQALVELSLRHYRSPDEQAAYLVREGLKRAGVLPPAEQKKQAAPASEPAR